MYTDRLVKLRNSLKLTQMEFAERLGISRSAISLIEIGKNPLTEQNIKIISFVFDVNEDWLRTGEGEMFTNDEQLKEHKFMATYKKLSPINQKMLLEFAVTMLDNQPANIP